MHTDNSNAGTARRDATDVESVPHTAAWQFSLRTLLIVTAFISVLLAIGVHFAGVIFVLLVVGVIQSVTLLSADWLIRPANRRALAFVTSGSWIILASGLLVIGVQQVMSGMGDPDASASRTFGLGLIAASAFCYYTASVRWRRLMRRGAASHS